MDLKNLKKNNKKIRFHPLSIILLNLLLPILNTFFPSEKGVAFSLLISILLLILTGYYTRFIKFTLFISIYFSLYQMSILYLKNLMIISLFKMTILFLPSFALASILLSEYNTSELLSALQMLKLPKLFIISLTVTLRYIPTFKKEFSLIKDSMKNRGVEFSFLHPMRTFEYLLVPQLFRCLALSEELTAAGLMKGINSPVKRTSYFYQTFKWRDYLVFIVTFLGYAIIEGGVI